MPQTIFDHTINIIDTLHRNPELRLEFPILRNINEFQRECNAFLELLPDPALERADWLRAAAERLSQV